MDYEHFHKRSIDWTNLARRYSKQGYFKDALWCMERSLELEYRGLQGLITVSYGTFMRNKLHVKAIERITNDIRQEKLTYINPKHLRKTNDKARR